MAKTTRKRRLIEGDCVMKWYAIFCVISACICVNFEIVIHFSVCVYVHYFLQVIIEFVVLRFLSPDLKTFF